MNLITTTVFDQIVQAHLVGKRLIINEGGTSSSKTISIIQFLIFIAANSKNPILISIVSESFPHLRRGAVRDFFSIMGEDFRDARWNKSESIYDFGSGRKIEFFSADQADKLRGGRRDVLFINEANNVNREAFDELDVRTRLFTVIDFNPVSEFWAHEMRDLPEVAWIHSTFVDAAHVLDKTVIDNILSRKDRDPAWWRVYGLGLVGKIEGLIHPKFSQCDALPEGGREIYGLDFGYSMDPAVLVRNRIIDDSIYSEELIYERGLTNDALAKRMDALGVRRGYDVIIADSAEPKSIEELKQYGFDIRPAVKGPDSVRAGIQKVNQYKQFWTKSSLNCIKEQRNYQWEKNPDGKYTEKPIDDWNHGMDGRRYAVATIPAPHIIAKTDSISDDFAVAFDKLEEYSALFCSIWMEKTYKTSILYCLWNARKQRLWVFGELCLPGPRAEDVLTASAKYLRSIPGCSLRDLRRFELYGNDLMHGGRNDTDLNDAAWAFSKFNLNLQENDFYDEPGAVLLVSRLIQRNGLRIHSRCQQTHSQVATWTAAEARPQEGYGCARALCNITSACIEASKYDPPPKPIRPWSKESQERREILDRLIKSDPDKFDIISEDEIRAMQSAGDDDAGAHWM